MALDAELLDQARAAGARVFDAEREVDVARADFHLAVRRLQLAGGSLREIAGALGLSHQRVHQMVDGAGGGRPWRIRRSGGRKRPPDPNLLHCSFCGKGKPEVGHLIAGPGVYVCEGCVDLADQAITPVEPAAAPLSAMSVLGNDVATGRCSFCGKRGDQVVGLAAVADVMICNECVALCREIIAEELGS
jgi:hypothetical protein